jgi:N-acetylglucosaminyldiphosphoundecaprenol N-acetyl-beta-D-mannosaminyltransferase
MNNKNLVLNKNTALKNKYERIVDKNEIPVCNILGVDIAAVNMNWLLNFLRKYIKSPIGNLLSGDYICVSNVHTTVLSYYNPDYCSIQNRGLMAIPDGGPLSTIGRRRGFNQMERTSGPSLMEKIFDVSVEFGYSHYFFGSTEMTLINLYNRLNEKYPGINITGLYSPPFSTVNDKDDDIIVSNINKSNSDFIWVGLGAPKQEKWIAAHQGKINGLMIGVGAGFDYFAGNINRAPEWMQNLNMEWVYRLIQDPKRLFKRYLISNSKFLWLTIIRGR